MHPKRRQFLKYSALIGLTAIGLDSEIVQAAWSGAEFAPGKMDTTLNALLKGKSVEFSDKLELIIPEIAENGALVPVTLSTKLEGIRSFALIAEPNPVPLVLHTEFTSEVLPFISARLKLAETGFVHALAETDKFWLATKKLVKVTIGGCGG